jgi:hypothetical protein
MTVDGKEGGLGEGGTNPRKGSDESDGLPKMDEDGRNVRCQGKK